MRKITIFISYAREDWDSWKALEHHLKLHDIHPTGDWMLPPGFEFSSQIDTLIRDADAILFILSPHSAASEWCRKEAEFANVLRKRILPVIINRGFDETALPASIRTPQWLPMHPGEEANSAAVITESLRTDEAWLRFHVRLGQLSNDWLTTKSRAWLPKSDLREASKWQAVLLSRPDLHPRFTTVQADFLLACKAVRLWLRLGSTAVIILLIAIAAVAYSARKATNAAIKATEAEKQLHFLESENRRKEQAGNLGRAALLQGEKTGGKTAAMLLASQSLRLYPNVDADVALRTQLALKPRLIRASLPSQQPMDQLAFLSGDHLLLGHSRQNELIVWKTTDWSTVVTPAAAAGCKYFWVDSSGNRVAIRDKEDKLTLWKIDEEGWSPLSPPTTPPGIPSQVIFDDGGKFLAICHDQENWDDWGNWEIFDLVNGNQHPIKTESLISELAFDTERSRCAAVISDGKQIQLFSLPDGESIQILDCPEQDSGLSSHPNFSAIEALRFLPDGQLVAIGNDILLWPRETFSGSNVLLAKNCSSIFPSRSEKTGLPISYAIGTDAKFGFGLIDGKPRIHQLNNNLEKISLSEIGGKDEETYKSFQDSVLTCRANTIAMRCAFDIWIWRVHNWPWRYERGKQDRLVAEVAAHLEFDGIRKKDSLRKDLITGKTEYYTPAFENHALSFDGSLLCTSLDDGSIQVWSTAGHPYALSAEPHYAVPDSCFSPDGRQVAVASNDGMVAVMEIASGKETARLGSGGFSGSTFGPKSVAFSPDGTLLASGEDSGLISLWDLNAQSRIARVRYETKVGIHHLVFSPNGNHLASSCYEKAARIWRIDNTTPEKLQPGPVLTRHDKSGEKVHHAAFFRDSSKIATASGDNTAAVWSVATGEQLLEVSMDHEILDVAVMPDGRAIGTAGMNGEAVVWDFPTGKQRFLCSHDKDVLDVDFSPDGNLFATASGDYHAALERNDEPNGEVQIWRCSERDLLIRLPHPFTVWSVEFSHDSRYVVTASYDRLVRVWEIASGREIARFKGGRDFTLSAHFSPDDKWIVSNGRVDFWRAPDLVAEAERRLERTWRPAEKRLWLPEPPKQPIGSALEN